MTAEPLIELDDRGRANLRQVGAEPHSQFMVHALPGGVYMLEPAVVVSGLEAEMWRTRPDLMQTITEALDDPSRWVKVRPEEL